MSLLNSFWTLHTFTKPLAQAYGLLNINEKEFIDPLKDPEYTTGLVIQHIRDLLINGILQYGPTRCILGYTYSKNEFALTRNIFDLSEAQLEDEVIVEKHAIVLIINILHEMGHMKKIQGYADGKYKKKTPEKFLKESGIYVECQLFGDFIKDRSYIKYLSAEAKKAFLNLDSWKEPCFLQKFKIEKSDLSCDKAFPGESSNLTMSNHSKW